MKLFFVYSLKKYFLVYLIYNNIVNAHKFMLFRSHKNTVAPKNCNLKPLEQKELSTPLPSSQSTTDVTDEMLRYHTLYTENHGLQPFTIDSNRENQALRWCHIQHHTSCDLIYPLNIAFNAAKVPAFLPMQQVVQFWYNQRKNYNFKKSFVSNIHLAQKEGYEILGYVNMISDAPSKHLGCCQASCDDGISVVYGCAYSPHGAGYWKLGESSQRTKGYLFFIPPSLEDNENFLSKPRENLVRHLPYEKLMDFGCSSRVPGNGPSTILDPWIFSCPEEENNVPVNNTLTNEKKFFFTAINVVTSGCQQSSESESEPFLLLCPKSCLKEVYNQYQTLTTVDVIEDKEQFALKDTSESLCGKELLEQKGYNVGPSTLFYVSSYSNHDILNNQECSATYETFLDCGSTNLQCFSRFKTPSVTNNWIVDSVETPLLNDVEDTFFILRHTMCTASTLKVQTLPLNKGFGNLGLIGGYLNPLNFIIYNIDTAKGEASLFMCSKSQCKRLDRTFLGSVLDSALRVELVIKASNTPPIQGKLNGETILSGYLLEKNMGIVGASGLALSRNAHFQFLESIVLLPEASSHFSDFSYEMESFSNNLLPLWTLGRIQNHTRILNLIESV